MMMHKVSRFLVDYDCQFTHFYTTGFYRFMEKLGLLDFTILGERQKRFADAYLREHNLPLDPGGESRRYDLVVTGTDIIVQDNIRSPLLLIQEGMTDPEDVWFHVVRFGAKLGVPRWIAKTSTTGLSHAYDRFCVASPGYRDHFIRKGVDAKKIVITGIPNWDDAKSYLNNSFEHRDYVLVATSDIRENFGFDNRRKLLERTRDIARGRQIIVKLHPNEDAGKRGEEVKRVLPEALVYSVGNSHEMVANCSCLVTQYSTLVYTGIALGKEVHSYFDVEELRRLSPIQNEGRSAENIATECRRLLARAPAEAVKELA